METGFFQTGFGNQQKDLSRSLRSKLQLDAVPVIEPRLPTLDELQVIYPGNVEPAVDVLFDLFLPARKRRRVLPESFTCAVSSVDPINPWKGRLRSSSKIVVDTQQEALAHSGKAADRRGSCTGFDAPQATAY